MADCQRRILRHDDGHSWWVCTLCQRVWNERVAGAHWLPSTCLEHRNNESQQDTASTYHAMPED